MKLKRVCSLFIVLAVLFSCIVSVEVVKADTIATIPYGFERLMYDGFDNNTGKIMLFNEDPSFPDYEVYDGGEGFAEGSHWMAGKDLSAELVYRTTGISGTNDSCHIDTDGNLVFNGKPDGVDGDTPFRQLAAPIAMDKDAEYVLVFTYITRNTTNMTHSLRLGNSTRTLGFACGSGRTNNQNDILPYLAGNGAGYKGTNLMPIDNITKITSVLQVSARADDAAYDVFKVKNFVHGVEEPTLTPSSWDYEHRAQDQLSYDLVSLCFNHNAGGTGNQTFKVDEIELYKSASCVVEKLHEGSNASYPANYMTFTAVGDVLEVSAASNNIYQNPQEIINCRWIDCTNSQDPVILSSELAYTVPESMINRYLQAEVTVKDTNANQTTTYYPYSQYVSDRYYAIDKAYLTTNGDTYKARLASQLTAGTGRNIGFRAEIRRTSNVDADRIATTAVAILAHYNKNGDLINIASNSITPPVNPAPVAASGAASVQMPGITVEEGDYFRGYVWYSKDTVKPLPASRSTSAVYLTTDSRDLPQ